MAHIFRHVVYADRTIKLFATQPMNKGEKGINNLQFVIPKRMYNLPVYQWVWWFVYVNAKNQEFTVPLVLSDYADDPNNYCVAQFDVDFGITLESGWIKFSLEAVDADSQGVINHRWRSNIYRSYIGDSLEGNQIEYDETESDIISALIQQVQNKVNSLVGGATPLPVQYKSQMVDHDSVYLYVGSEAGESTNYWYYYNGSAWVAGGLYASGITVDAVPTQGSANAVSSGGVYDELENISGHAFPSTAKVLLINLLQNAIYTSDQSGTIEALNNALNVGDIVPVTGISLDAQSKSVTVGNTVSISATVTPSNATNKGVVWTSSDESVATVDGGVVTGRGQGTVIITAKTIDGGYTATCSVTSTIVNLLDRSKSSISNYDGLYLA